MALIWGLAIPLPAHLGLLLFGFVVCGIWMLFSKYLSQKQGAATTQTSQQHGLKKIQKPTVSELEESSGMDYIEANLTYISGLPMTWTQEYLLWSIERSLRQIFHHLDNARSSLMEPSLPESQDMTSSSASSELRAQEVVRPCCYCKKAKHSTTSSISSASSNNSSSLSYFPVFPERRTWQFHGNSLPASPSRQPSVFSSQGPSLSSSFRLTSPEKTELLKNLAALSPLQSQQSFTSPIGEPPNPCQQQDARDERKTKSHLVPDRGTNSVLDKTTGFPGGVPLRLSPLTRGELGHMSQVSTLQKQTVPLPVRKSWEMLKYQVDVQGVPEPEYPQTQLSTPTPQNAERGTNRISQDLPSFHLHVNAGVDSQLNRTETKISQSHISVKQLQSGDDPQILASEPSLTSMGTPPPRYLGANILQEETTLLKKDPKHVLELSIGQRVIGLPEKRMESHKTQVTNMELTPRQPHQVTDSIKITPLALLQVMDSMGMIPESHSEVIESVGLFTKPPNQVVKPRETVSVTPKPRHQVIESVKVTSSPQNSVEPKTMRQVTGKAKVTPGALLCNMESMGLRNKLHPQVLEPVKTDALLHHRARKPGEMSPRPHHTAMETVEMTPGLKHNIKTSVSMTSGSQIPAMEQVKITPGLIHQNRKSLEIISTPMHQVMDYTQVTSGTLQAMDFMGTIPPVKPNFREPGIPGSQSQAAYLIPMSAQPDGLTSNDSTIVPLETVEPVSSTARCSHNVTETAGLTSDTQTQMKRPRDLAGSHQTMEYLRTILGSPGQGTEPIGMSQGPWPQDMESEVVTTTSPLPGRKYTEVDSMQCQAVGSQDVKPENLIVDPGLQRMKSVDVTPDLIPQMATHGQLAPTVNSMEMAPECQWKNVEPEVLTNLSQQQREASEPSLPNTSSDKRAPETLLKDAKTPHVAESGRVISEAQAQSLKVGELAPSAHLTPVKSAELNPRPSCHTTALEGVTPLHQALGPVGMISEPGCQATGAKWTSDTCHKDEESVGLTQSPVGISPASLSQASESMEMSCTSFQGALELKTQVVKEIGETPAPQNTAKDTLNLQSIKPEMLSSQPQPSGVMFGHLNLGPCSEGTKSSEVPLRSESEHTETVGLPMPQLDETPGVMPGLDLEVGSLKFSLRPGGQSERSESLLQSLKYDELISELSSLLIGPTELPTGPKPLVKDLSPGLQLEGMESGPREPGPQLPDEKSGNVIQQSAIEVGVPEKPKPESGLLSMTKGTCLQSVRSADLNPGLQQSGVKSAVTLGPQLQTVRLSELSPGLFLQGEHPAPLISGPPHCDVTSEETTPGVPAQENAPSDFNPGQNHQNVKFTELISESPSQGMTSVELTSGPSLKDVRFSDLTLESKNQSLKYIQLTPGVQFQDRQSQGSVPESFLQLSQEPQVDDINPALPMAGSEFHSIKPTIQASEQFYKGVISKKVNLGLRQQDIRSSELVSEPKFQGVKFGHQTPESMFHGVNSAEVTPELCLHDPKLTKMSLGLQDMKQVGLNSGPWLQDVRLFDLTPETQPQGMICSELVQGPHLEYVQPMVQTPGSRLQGLKSKTLTPEPQLEDTTTVPPTPRPHLGGMKSMPELGQIKSRMLTPRLQAGAKKSEVLIPGSKHKGLKSKFRPSGSQPEDRTSVVLIPEQCLEGMTPSATTPSPLVEGGKYMTFSSSRTQDLQTVELFHGSHARDVKAMEDAPKRPDRTCAAFVPGPLLQVIQSMEMLQGSQQKGMKPKELISEPQIGNWKHVEIIPGLKPENLSSIEEALDPQLQCGKSVNTARKRGERSVNLASEQQFQGTAPVDFTLGPGQDGQMCASSPEWKWVDPDTLKRGCETENILSSGSIPEPKSQGIKSTDLNSKLRSKDIKSFELAPEPVLQDVQAKDFECKRQLQRVKSHKSTPGSTEEPHPRGVKTEELNREPQHASTKSVQWLPGPGVQGEKCVRSSLRPQPQGVKPAEQKQSTQLGGVKSSEVTGAMSGDFHLKPQRQQTHVSWLFPGPELQNRKISASTSEPQLQGVKTVAIHKEPQLGSVKSIQWIPGPGFQGVKSAGLHFGPRCQGVKPVGLKPSMQSGCTKPSEMTLGPKLQGEKSKGFNEGPQVQHVKPPELSPELQKGGNVPSISEPQLQDVKGPGLGNMKSIQWIPVPNLQVMKSMFNIGLQYQVTAAQLKPSIQLRNMETSELASRPNLPGRQPSVSVQERQPHRLKPVRRMKSFDSTSRSKPGDTTSMMFKPGFNLLDVKFSELDPGLQLRKEKPLASSPRTQVQGMKSLQELQLSGMKSRILSQGPQLQNDEIIQLITTKSSELALQTQPQRMKSEDFNPGLQWQCVKYSKLTPKIKSQYMKYAKPSPSSQLKGTHHGSHDLAMGTKTQSAKIVFKPGPQMQGMKSSESVQSVKSVGCESDPQLHDLKSSRMIMGIKLQDIKSMDCSPGPHLQGVKPSEVIPEKKLQGEKAPKLQEEKSNLTLGKKFPGMKSVGQGSGTHLQETKSSELIMGIKLQGVKSTGQRFQSPKPCDLAMETKPHGGKSASFDARPQTQSKKLELTQGEKLENVKSAEFSHGTKSQSVTPELLSETKLQTEGSVKFNSGSQLQDVKYSKLIVATKLQNIKTMGCSPQAHIQRAESPEAIPETKLAEVQDGKFKPASLQATSDSQDYGSVLQVGRLFELIHGEEPPKFNAGGRQDEKSHQWSQPSQLRSRKSRLFCPKPHLQHLRSSEPHTETKLPDVKSVKYNSQKLLQDVKSELGLGTELLGAPLLGFNPRPQLQCITPSDLCIETKLGDEPSLEFKHEPKWQCGKSSELSCEPGPQIRPKDTTFNTGSQSHDIQSSELNHNPDLQNIKSQMFCCGPHFQDVNSACIPGSNPQCVNSPRCAPRPKLQGMNSSACIPGPNSQCANSTGCNPEPHLQGVNSSACSPRPKPQCMNSAGCNPGPHMQGVNSSACSPRPKPQCMNSAGCNPGPHMQGVNSSACSPRPKPQCINFAGCNPGPHMQGVNSSACTPGPKPQCMNSAGCNPGPHLQGVKQSKPNAVSKLQSNSRPQVQCVNFSELNPGSKLQYVNFMECKFGPPLQSIRPFELTSETKLQGVRSSGMQPVPEFQGRESSVQRLQDIKCELTPGTSMEFNSGPQFQGINSSELNSESKHQCINSKNLSPGPQLQNMKTTDLTPGSESQGTKSVLFNSGPHLQGVKISDLMLGAKFQGVPFLENQLGSQQQTVQPVFTLRPQSNAMKSVVVLPNPLLQDVRSVEMSKQSLLCDTNAIRLTSGFGMQDLEYEVFTLEPCFQNVKSVQLKPGPQAPSVNSLGLSSSLRSQCVKSVVIAPKSCFQEAMPLRLGSQEQRTDYGKLTLGWHSVDPMVLPPEPARKFLSGPTLASVKFSNLVPESHQPGMKSWEFTPESKWQSVKHVKLSSMSLQQTVKSMESSPQSLLQSVKPGNQAPQTNDQITDSSEAVHTPKHQFVEYAEMTPKVRHQVSTSMKLISAPMYQTTESAETVKDLLHNSTESVEKSMGWTPKPTGNIMEPSGFVALTPVLWDQGSKPLELIPEESYQVPETLESLSHSWPPLKDLEELCTKQVTESRGMAAELKHGTEARRLARLPGKGLDRMTPKPVSQATKYAQKTQRSSPRDLEPVALVSEGRPTQKESIVVTPMSYHALSSDSKTPGRGHPIPASVELTPKSQPHVGSSGIALELRPQLPESVNSTSQWWLQVEESLKLFSKQTSQVGGNSKSVALASESRQPRPTQPQDQRAPSGPQDTVTAHARTQLQAAPWGPLTQVAPRKVAECEKGTRGSRCQVVTSVMTPETPPPVSKYDESTPKLQDVSLSEITSSLWLQNVKSKELITQPTHQILETMELSGFQIIKTVLIPGPLLQVVRSENLAPGPIPQVVEPIGVATGSQIKVTGGLNLLPRAHLSKLIKPTEFTPRPSSQMDPTELTLQQASPLEEFTVLTREQRLQATKSIGDLKQGLKCQNRAPEVLTSEELQVRNYFSRFIHSPSTPPISRPVKTSELVGGPQDLGMPDVSRTLGKKHLGMDILQPDETYTDPTMIRSSSLPLPLHNLLSDQTVNTVDATHPESWGVDVISEEGTLRKHMEELEDSLQSYSPYPPPSWRSPSENFQSGSGTRKGPIRSFLSRQQNIWESHACRQRLPRKYRSTMLMLGKVLGTTMGRNIYSQTRLAKGATVICQSIQNLFGVPAELMEFSQTLLQKGPSMISQTSGMKNYIQRQILCHGNEKRMPSRMWTRCSTSSIIRQYSRTRLGIRKTNSKLSDIFLKVSQHTSVSGSGGQFPALVKSESSLGILSSREDPMRECESSQHDRHARTFEYQHSFKTTCFPQAKTNVSEQLHRLQDLHLKIAAKLLRSQLPPSVPPPLASGLVLKYPICLQCGQCSGYKCCHKLQSTLGPYLIIYPQLHLISTPEGHGEIRLHLGFRLRTGKKIHFSKYHGRDKSDVRRRTASPPQRKASKSHAPTQDFQSRASQPPTGLQVHAGQRQWGSPDMVGKTETGDLGHHEFHKVYSLSESDSESNQDGKWAIMRIKKISAFKYPMKRITKRLRPQSTKLLTIIRSLGGRGERPSRESSGPLRKKNSGTVQTSTASLKRQPKKSSQSKFMHLLLQGLRQAFQAAHGMTAFVGKKPGSRMRIDNLWSSKNYPPKQKDSGYCIPIDSKKDRMTVMKQSPTGSTMKQEGTLQGPGHQCRSAQQSKQESSWQPRPLQQQQSTVSRTDRNFLPSSTIQPLGTSQNDNRAKKNHGGDSSIQESKDFSKQEPGFQAQGRILSGSLLKRTLYSRFKKRDTHKDGNQHGFFRGKERPLQNAQTTSPPSPSERMLPRVFGWSLLSRPERTTRDPSRKHGSPLDRSCHSPERPRSPSERPRSSSRRSPRGPSERSPRSPSGRRSRSPSGRRPRSPSGRRSRSPSERRPRSPSGRRSRSPSGRRSHSPSGRRPRSPSGRRPRSPSGRRPRCPSERRPRCPSERSPRSPSERRPRSPSGRRPRSPFGRRPRSPFGRRPRSPSGRRSHSPSGRRPRSPSGRRPRCPSERSPRSPSERRPRSPSGRRPRSPFGRRPRSPSERRPRSPSERSPRSPFGRRPRSPSERCHSPSARTRPSPLERSYGSLSEGSAFLGKAHHGHPARSPPSRAGRRERSHPDRAHGRPKERLQLPHGQARA